MKMESCFLIKPDPEKCHLVAKEAVKMVIELGLTPRFIGEKKLSLEEAIAFYKDFEGECWFFEFIKYLTSSEVLIYITEGEDAIEKTLEVKRKIRERHAIDKQKNAIHAPKEEQSARETCCLIRKIFLEDH